MSADVVIIRGAPGVGKSQAAKALASFFPTGAKVEVDVLRNMVIAVDWKNQQEHMNLLQMAARLTHEFINVGFWPIIVVDTFSGDKVFRFIDTLQRLNGALKIRSFALFASDEVLRKRLESRPPSGFKEFEVCQKLNADVLRIRLPDDSQIDTSELTPPQTAEQIFQQLLRK